VVIKSGERDTFSHSALTCWFGDRKGIQPVKGWVLVTWWWWSNWSFVCLVAPLVTTISIILSSNKIQNRDILVTAYPWCSGKWPLNECQMLFLTPCHQHQSTEGNKRYGIHSNTTESKLVNTENCVLCTYSIVLEFHPWIWCCRCTGRTSCHIADWRAWRVSSNTWSRHSWTCQRAASWRRRCLACTRTILLLAGLWMTASWRFTTIGWHWIHIQWILSKTSCNTCERYNLTCMQLIAKTFN